MPQPMVPDLTKPADATGLKKASEDLKSRIEEAKKRNDMPLDSTLGNPKWDQDAADGHLDRKDDEED